MNILLRLRITIKKNYFRTFEFWPVFLYHICWMVKKVDRREQYRYFRLMPKGVKWKLYLSNGKYSSVIFRYWYLDSGLYSDYETRRQSNTYRMQIRVRNTCFCGTILILKFKTKLSVKFVNYTANTLVVLKCFQKLRIITIKCTYCWVVFILVITYYSSKTTNLINIQFTCWSPRVRKW